MELLSSLSKETSNDFHSLMKLPVHYLMGLYNSLKKILKEEQKARKEAEDKQSGSIRMPSMPSMPSMPNMPKIG